MKTTKAIPIRRQQILSCLLLGVFVATLMPGCSDDYDTSDNDDTSNTADISTVRELPPNDAIADQPVDAVFYENIEECKQDLTQKYQEYQTAQQEFQAGKLTVAPIEPTLKPEDCAAQIALSLREHEENAPVYNTLEKCQAEGTECSQATEGGFVTQGYYPSFGGTFIYPYDPTPDFVYFYYGGVNHRVYRPSTVYRSATPGMLVTPYGRTLSRYQPGGKISVPQHTRFTAPARPEGMSGSGVIRGRSSTGFGSTYKSTGRGGIGK